MTKLKSSQAFCEVSAAQPLARTVFPNPWVRTQKRVAKSLNMSCGEALTNGVSCPSCSLSFLLTNFSHSHLILLLCDNNEEKKAIRQHCSHWGKEGRLESRWELFIMPWKSQRIERGMCMHGLWLGDSFAAQVLAPYIASSTMNDVLHQSLCH